MSKEKTAKARPDSAKKQTRLQVTDQLQAALPALQALLGDKEFESRIKKAARLLTEGIKIKKKKSPTTELPMAD